MAGGQPRRAHDAFLFKDIIAIVLLDHEVGRLEVETVEDIDASGD